MSKTDLIIKTLMEIKEDIGNINGHLKSLNGKVIDHRVRVIKLETDNIKNKIKWAKVAGIAIACSAIVSLTLKFII